MFISVSIKDILTSYYLAVGKPVTFLEILERRQLLTSVSDTESVYQESFGSCELPEIIENIIFKDDEPFLSKLQEQCFIDIQSRENFAFCEWSNFKKPIQEESIPEDSLNHLESGIVQDSFKVLSSTPFESNSCPLESSFAVCGLDSNQEEEDLSLKFLLKIPNVLLEATLCTASQLFYWKAIYETKRKVDSSSGSLFIYPFKDHFTNLALAYGLKNALDWVETHSMEKIFSIGDISYDASRVIDEGVSFVKFTVLAFFINRATSQYTKMLPLPKVIYLSSGVIPSYMALNFIEILAIESVKKFKEWVDPQNISVSSFSPSLLWIDSMLLGVKKYLDLNVFMYSQRRDTIMGTKYLPFGFSFFAFSLGTKAFEKIQNTIHKMVGGQDIDDDLWLKIPDYSNRDECVNTLQQSTSFVLNLLSMWVFLSGVCNNLSSHTELTERLSNYQLTLQGTLKQQIAFGLFYLNKHTINSQSYRAFLKWALDYIESDIKNPSCDLHEM